MSRNRAKNTHSLHWATVLTCIAVVMTVSILGASFVALKNKVLRLAAEVRTQEVDLDNWKRRNQQLQYNINRVSSYEELQRRITFLNSGMVKIGELDVQPMDSSRPERSAFVRGPTP